MLFGTGYFKYRTEKTHSHKSRTHKSHDLIISLIASYDILTVITNNKCRKIQSWQANNFQRTIWTSGLRIPLQILQNFFLLSWNKYKTSVSILTEKHCLSFRVTVIFCVRVSSPDYTTRFGSWLKGISSWKLEGPIFFFRLRASCILFCSPCNPSDIKFNIIPFRLLWANQSQIRYFGCLGYNALSGVWFPTFKERHSIVFKEPSVSRRELPRPCLWQHYVPSKFWKPHKYNSLPCHRRNDFSEALQRETQIKQVRSIRHFSLSTVNTDCSSLPKHSVAPEKMKWLEICWWQQS